MKYAYLSIVFSLFLFKGSLALGASRVPPENSARLWVEARGYANFSTCKASPNTKGKTIVISEKMIVNSLTVPVDRSLKFINKGELDIADGKTVKILGTLEAPLNGIFSGPGKVVFAPGILKEIYPQWWGAKADGVTDDGRAVMSACETINASGGGTLVFSNGLYLLYKNGTSYRNLANFSNLNGVNIICRGARLLIDPSRTFNVSYATMLLFSNCKNIVIDGFDISGQTPDISKTAVSGIEFVRFVQGCENISMPKNKVKGVIAGAIFSRLPSDPDSYICKNIDIGILDVNNSFYGISCQFSGNNMSVRDLITDTVHRSYFIFGVNHHSVRINSKNPYANDCYLAAFSGKGCENIRVVYTNTESRSSSVFCNLVSIGWNGITPAIFKNIYLDVNIVYHPGRQSGSSGVYIFKYDDNYNPDSQDRGHKLENLYITGSIHGIPQYIGAFPIHTLTSCHWGPGDHWNNIRIKNMRLSSSKPMLIDLGSVEDSLILENVTSDSDIVLAGKPRMGVTYINVTAPNHRGTH